MPVRALSATLAASLFLAACDGEKSCSEDEAMEKLNQVAAKFQTAILTRPGQMEALSIRFAELMSHPASDEDQISELCHALDQMIRELD